MDIEALTRYYVEQARELGVEAVVRFLVVQLEAARLPKTRTPQSEDRGAASPGA